MTEQKRGRKTKYFTNVEPYLDDIILWRQSGLSEEEIAKKLDVGTTAFNEYKIKYPEFQRVVRTSKEKLVNNLKRSLFKESLGYEYEEVKTTIEESYLGTKKKVEKTKKYARSQPNLLIFALCNLCPELFQRVDKEAIKELKDEFEKELLSNKEQNSKILKILYGKTIEEKEKEIKNKDNEHNDKS